MDEYLKPFIHGVATLNKPHKEVLSNGSKHDLSGLQKLSGKHLEQATPFYVERPPGDSTDLVGGDKDSTSRPFAHSVPEGPYSTGGTETEAMAHFQDLQIPRLTSRSTNKEIQTRLFTQRYVFRTFSGQFDSKYTSNGALKVFHPRMGNDHTGPLDPAGHPGLPDRSCNSSSATVIIQCTKAFFDTRDRVLEQEVKELLMKQAIHPVQSPEPAA
ncbi:Hypothetical predicted protein [Paramuricea clavata]|uniref:Uncharacterized protein n=1 Tax=Paramuricea clavata TaxID=317549 RepID=A0A7D9F047_PARCT|nr:Hypothetical predicted protein [Paramuricea clavata]